jgi:hypothetical protein
LKALPAFRLYPNLGPKRTSHPCGFPGGKLRDGWPVPIRRGPPRPGSDHPEPVSAAKPTKKPNKKTRNQTIMKKLLTTIGLAAVTLAGITGANAQLVAVERIGDGSTTLSGNATDVNLLVYNGTTLDQTISMPTTGPNRLTDSGTATSNGYFNFYNGRYAVGGYNSALGTASVASSNTKAVNFLAANGTITANTQVATTNWTGNNFRSAITTDGVNFYGSGAGSGSSGGIRFVDSSGNGTRLTSNVTNTRNIEIYNNNLLFSTGSGTTGIYSLGALSSLDTSSDDQNTATLLIGTDSPYGFFMDFTNGVAFVASDASSTNGGISRWDFNTITSTWDQTWKFRLDSTVTQFTSAASSGSNLVVRGLTGAFDSITNQYSIWATTTQTSNNQVIKFTDGLITSITAGSSYDLIASAGANYVFRGVDVVPEPSTWALLAGSLTVLTILRRRRRNMA